MSIKADDKWTWGKDAFVNNNFGFYIPGYYDAEMPSSSNLKSGTLNKESGLFTGDKKTVSIKGGPISYAGYQASIWPSESVNLIMPLGDSSIDLPYNPSFKYTPHVSTYKVADNKIIPARTYLYSPGTLYTAGNNKKYKFNILGSTYNIACKEVPNFSYSDIVISKVDALSNGSNIFVVPEFPIIDITINTPIADVDIDYLRGVIYTNDAVTSISVTYTASALISYVPINTVENNKYFFDKSLQADTFSILTHKPDYYRGDELFYYQ